MGPSTHRSEEMYNEIKIKQSYVKTYSRIAQGDTKTIKKICSLMKRSDPSIHLQEYLRLYTSHSKNVTGTNTYYIKALIY